MNATLELVQQRAVPVAALRTVRVALAGCGVVGSELVRLLQQSAGAIQQQHGLRFELTRVLIQNADKQRALATPDGLFTNDLDAFLRTPADVVIEAIGGLQPALRIAQATVQRGARFITANKSLIATHGAELHGVRPARRGQIQFEAAVGASVPVIRVLREALGTARPAAIRGILNGTSNFVLSRLEEGIDMADAIAEAQRRGLAEADPARDLDGRDVADKIAILAWLAHGVTPGQLQTIRHGLLPHGERIVKDALAVNARVRLIGECVASADGVFANVEPVMVAADSGFGRTLNENNLITIDFGWKAPIQLAGPGAGGLPTATALLGDLLDAGSTLNIPNDPPACVRDPRAHRWSVSVNGNERAALEHVRASNIATSTVQLRRDALCFHTAPITRAELSGLVGGLEAIGARPAVVRLELTEAAS